MKYNISSHNSSFRQINGMIETHIFTARKNPRSIFFNEISHQKKTIESFPGENVVQVFLRANSQQNILFWEFWYKNL